MTTASSFGLCQALDSFLAWAGLRFPCPQMEAKFQAQRIPSLVNLSYAWCIGVLLTTILGIALKAARHVLLVQSDRTVFLASFGPLAIIVTFCIVAGLVSAVRPYAHLALCLTCLLMLVAVNVNAVLLADLEVQTLLTSTATQFLDAFDGQSAAQQQFRSLFATQVGQKRFWMSMFQCTVLFDFLRYIGLDWKTLVVFLSMPAGFAITSVIASTSPWQLCEPLLFGTFISLYSSIWCYYVSRLQRERFALDYTLKQSLENEANAVQQVLEKERVHKEMSKDADTVLNHILKNMLADAAGSIHLYLESFPGTVPPDLAQAMSCLDSGMAWCRKRQALVSISAGDYVLTLTDVHLKEFGAMLTRGRPIVCAFLDEVVTLDPVLCGIVLDNGLSYAFRYSDTRDPQAEFHMQLDPPPERPGSASRRLTFRIMNRAHPELPPLTGDILGRLLAGERLDHLFATSASALGDQLGLQYMFMAAKAHGMVLTLQQEGDFVVLEASMDVLWVPSIPSDDCVLLEDCPSLPEGLTIVCVDDSAIARRLLVHTISSATINATIHTFGQTPAEIQAFMETPWSQADMIILDQHLDYGHISFLGTDLLWKLRQGGYSGFACIRSANISVDNQTKYLQSGAHCAIGKDVRPQEMLNSLKTAYAQFRKPKRLTAHRPTSHGSLTPSWFGPNSNDSQEHLLRGPHGTRLDFQMAVSRVHVNFC